MDRFDKAEQVAVRMAEAFIKEWKKDKYNYPLEDAVTWFNENLDGVKEDAEERGIDIPYDYLYDEFNDLVFLTPNHIVDNRRVAYRGSNDDEQSLSANRG